MARASVIVTTPAPDAAAGQPPATACGRRRRPTPHWRPTCPARSARTAPPAQAEAADEWRPCRGRTVRRCAHRRPRAARPADAARRQPAAAAANCWLIGTCLSTDPGYGRSESRPVRHEAARAGASGAARPPGAAAPSAQSGRESRPSSGRVLPPSVYQGARPAQGRSPRCARALHRDPPSSRPGARPGVRNPAPAPDGEHALGPEPARRDTAT